MKVVTIYTAEGQVIIHNVKRIKWVFNGGRFVPEFCNGDTSFALNEQHLFTVRKEA